MYKRLTAFLAAVTLIFTCFPASAAYASAEYIALGDSIAHGYGLAAPETDSYPAKFAAAHKLELKNYGIDGQTAKQLLAAVQNGDYDLSGADVITVSTGSNELLQYSLGIIAKEFGVDTSSDIASGDLSAALTETIADMPSNIILIHALNIQDEFRNNEELYAICDELKNNTLPALAAEIRKQNPDAQLIFNNIYNPYKNMDIIFPLTETRTERRNLGNYIQPYITRVNSGFKTTDSYIVADIESVFTKSGYVNADLDMRDMDTFSFDPHPTRAGHEAIKNQLNKLYVAPASEETTAADDESTTTDDSTTKEDPSAVVTTTEDKKTESTTASGTETTKDASPSGSAIDNTPSGSAVDDDPSGSGIDPAPFYYGDVNSDGAITAADSAMVLQYVLNKGVEFDTETLKKADVNADGAITSADSAQILQKALVSSFVFDVENKYIIY